MKCLATVHIAAENKNNKQKVQYKCHFCFLSSNSHLLYDQFKTQEGQETLAIKIDAIINKDPQRKGSVCSSALYKLLVRVIGPVALQDCLG